jgi:hypothetical protein
MTSMNRYGFIVLAAVGLGLACLPATGADVLYVSGQNDEFGTLDIATGQFHQIGTFSLTNGATMFGMASTGAGTLVGIDDNGEAYQINPTNAATTDLFPTVADPIGGGGNGSPIMYLFDNNPSTLYAIDFAHASVTPIGTYNFFGDGLVAVGPDGSVYVSSFDISGGGASDELFKINPLTGKATDLGSTGAFSLFAGAFVGGTLYGFDKTGDILTLDTTTGTATTVGTYVLPRGDAIFAAAEMMSVPEPSSIILAGLAAIGGLSGFVRRSRA